MPGLDLPDPCPGTWILGLQGRLSMHSRPPRSLPEANPPPDLREGSQRHFPRPTSAKPQSGRIPGRPLKKSGGRENSCRANPGPTWASLAWKQGFPLENRISLLEAYAKILKVPSRMVFGHNLHYMAPFAIPRAGFCMVFSARICCFFHARGRILEPGVRFWIPRSTFWPGDLFGSIFGSRKNILLRGNYFVVWIHGIPSCPNEFYGP